LGLRASTAPSSASVDSKTTQPAPPDRKTEDPPELPVVVLFNGAPHDIGAVVSQLKSLRETGVAISLLACPSFAAAHNVEALAGWLDAPVITHLTPRQAMRVAHRLELLIWATVSENTTNRLANGVADTPQADLISRALKTHRPVLASAPDLWARGPYGYSRDPQEALFRRNYATLEEWGIHTVESGSLDAAAREILKAPDPEAARELPRERTAPDTPIITLHDVQDARARDEAIIKAPADARLTDLAREFLERNNMKLERP
jgi:hypothetical protein